MSAGDVAIPGWLGAALLEWPEHADRRGSLVAVEVGAQVPFPIARVFFVRGIPDGGATRGGHAHRACHEVLVAVEGTVVVRLDDGTGPGEVVLDRPTRGVHVRPLQWLELRFEPGAVLLALCSHPFDEADYVRDPAAWRALVGGGAGR